MKAAETGNAVEIAKAGDTMKAVICASYGDADVLRVAEVERPVPGENQILVRVHESLVTPSDIAGRKGEPFIVRFFTGLPRPKAIMGSDLAGVVEAVGPEVTDFRIGDRVFGSAAGGFGANAEYVCLDAGGPVAKIPEGKSFAHTAGFCDAAMTALSFLRDEAGLKPGQEILINGASGAIGTFALQLARHFGARITAVCGPDNIERVRELGAHHVIDYHREDFTAELSRYDVIFDAVGKSSFARCKPALKSGGVYMTTVPGGSVMLQMFWTKIFGDRRAIFAATGLQQTREKLDFLVELMLEGELRSVVDRRFPLAEVAAAHRYVETGHKRGNVVLEMPV